MATKRGGLGRGLNALIGAEEEKPAVQEQAEVNKKEDEDSSDTKTQPAGPVMVSIYDVEPDREQPRKTFDEEGLKELAQSLKEYGILQPILVNQCDGYYKIIAGERRWRAARLAGLEEVPVLIKEIADAEAFEISLIENIQRQDLNPLEEALAYRHLMDEYGMTQERVSQRIGVSRSAVANAVRLLNLAEPVQTLIRDGQLSSGHAKVLTGIADSKVQVMLAQEAAENGWSVKQLEAAVKRAESSKKPAQKAAPASEYADIERRMQEMLGTRVSIQPGRRKSKIEIEYYTEDDLNRLLMLFGSMHDEQNE